MLMLMEVVQRTEFSISGVCSFLPTRKRENSSELRRHLYKLFYQAIISIDTSKTVDNFTLISLYQILQYRRRTIWL
jgi:hypothetical protein